MNNKIKKSPDKTSILRKSTPLNFYEDDFERKRLKLQKSFLFEFGKDCYDSFISDLKDGSFLDLGCSTGEQAMMFCEERKEIKNFVGIDREEKAIDFAKKKYPKGHFYACDVETEGFDDFLYSVEEELQIEGFDIINISMLLLHLKKPYRFLNVVSKHLKKGGRIIILDIDDSSNISSPDEKGIFARAMEMCAISKYSGNRTTGREVPELLSETKMKNIKLHKKGISTKGMDSKQRKKLFDVYFSFILDDLRKMNKENTKDIEVAQNLEWMEANYRTMLKIFKDESFFFSLGCVLFSAIK
jgi:SAM-dependent methyltransferase